MGQRSLLVLIAIVGLGLLASPGYAYGPNVIDDAGVVTWQLPVIIDTEGDQIKNCPGETVDLTQHIADAAAIWEGAPETGLNTTIFTITKDGSPLAIDDTNYCDVMFDQGSCPFGGNAAGPNEAGGFSPVVFDEDGAITDLFFGTGAKRSTLGFAGIVLKEANTLNASKGEGVINLFCMDPCGGGSCLETFSSDDVLSFVVHELGHFFGFNHTQVNFDQMDKSFTTTMFAVFDPGSPADLTTLERDDQVGVADLYPNGTNDLDNDFCTVTGTIIDEDSEEFQCANVIARNTDPAKRLSDAMSYVSGGDQPGGTTQAGRGDFTIRGLEPGETYEITVQPIDTSFPLNQVASGVIPCNGGSGNPTAPTFDVQTLTATVTCQAGDTEALGDIVLSNTSTNVASTGSGSGSGSGSGTGGNGSGGCSLIR